MDVIVCDGFVGNVVLKSAEALAEFILRMLREEIAGSPRGKLGYQLAKPAFDRFRERTDYSEYGAAPLLGLNGGCFIGHGRSNARAIQSAIRRADGVLQRPARPQDPRQARRAAQPGGALSWATTARRPKPDESDRDPGRRRSRSSFPARARRRSAWARRGPTPRPRPAQTFEEADEALGFPLSRLCWEGPEEELNLTANTQPALVAAAIAVHRALAVLAPELAPVAMAGHSLGEYSALVAAGALGFADALRLVRRRGELMQEAVPVGEGAMAAIIGLDAETIAAIAAEATEGDEVCAVANLNGPAQTVIAGHKAAIDRAVALAKERGARKATLLAVSAPFHSPLMRPAREGMAAAARGDRVPRPAGAGGDQRRRRSGDHRGRGPRRPDPPDRQPGALGRVGALDGGALGVETFVEVGPGNVLSRAEPADRPLGPRDRDLGSRPSPAAAGGGRGQERQADVASSTARPRW